MVVCTPTPESALEALHLTDMFCSASGNYLSIREPLSNSSDYADSVHQMHCRVAPRGRENPSAPAVEIPAFLRKRRTRGK